MTIDEAIAHARDVANEQKRRSSICIQNDSECDKFSDCLKCSEEHEQLAEWLEELKCYKNDNDFSDYADRLHKIAFNSGYNKALDDFVEYVWETTGSSDIEWITRDYELYDLLQKKAEQLKEGGQYK